MIENGEAETDPHKADGAKEIQGPVYAGLVSYYVHQNWLLWSRTQIIIAIQVATLGSGYGLRDIWIGPVLLIVGGVLTIAVWGLMWMDVWYRDQVISALNVYASRSFPPEMQEKHRTIFPPPKDEEWALLKRAGGVIITCVIFFFSAVDFVFAYIFFFVPNFFPSKPANLISIIDIQNLCGILNSI